MDELKPCPFCGGKNIEVYYFDPWDGYQGNCGSYIANCTRCGVKMQRRTALKVAEAWNRRADQ